MSEFVGVLFDVLYILNIFFAIVIVFSERKNPAVSWAWLMVALILPYFGFVIYLILGFDGRKHKSFLQKSKHDEEMYKTFLNLDINCIGFLKEQMDFIKTKNIMHVLGMEHFDDIVYLNFVAGNAAYSENNKIKLFHEGVSMFDALVDDIRAAKRFIHMEYYIVKDDELGNRIISELTKAAKRGVSVKFLMDGMGCAQTDKSLFVPLANAGGEVLEFLPPAFVRLNFRDHRKLAIIDGKVGYIGGLNIGDEYVGKSKKFGYWRDCHVRAYGEATHQMELRFLMDWNFVSKTQIPLTDELFPKFENVGLKTGVQIVSSGPDTKWSSIQYAYAKMISEANKSICIQTPYFVPDDSVLEAIKIAALSGIDVKVIIPAKPDHPFVYWAGLSYLGELLPAGVKCYKYKKGFVHSKLIVVDSIVSSVGTANLDVRSFKLNFEVNAFIYDENCAKELEEHFHNDLEFCDEITLESYNNRSKRTKIKESVSRLLSPIL